MSENLPAKTSNPPAPVPVCLPDSLRQLATSEEPITPTTSLPTRPDLAHGIALLEAGLTGTSEAWIVKRLGRLILTTAPRADMTPAEGRAMAAEYARHLSRYPADILDRACDRAARTCKFWPTLAELEDAAGALLVERRAMLNRLHAAYRMHDQAQQLRRPEAITLERYQQRKAELAAMPEGEERATKLRVLDAIWRRDHRCDPPAFVPAVKRIEDAA